MEWNYGIQKRDFRNVQKQKQKQTKDESTKKNKQKNEKQ